MVVGEIAGNLSATPRESTNLIDVYFLSPDPAIAPHVLNTAAAELRRRGAKRVGRRATADIEFIEQRLESARRGAPCPRSPRPRPAGHRRRGSPATPEGR